MNAQVEQLIAMMRAAIPPDAPRMWQLPAAEARARGDAFFGMLNRGGPEMAERRDLTVPARRGAIAARLYVPRNVDATSPGLLYLLSSRRRLRDRQPRHARSAHTRAGRGDRRTRALASLRAGARAPVSGGARRLQRRRPLARPA